MSNENKHKESSTNQGDKFTYLYNEARLMQLKQIQRNQEAELKRQQKIEEEILQAKYISRNTKQFISFNSKNDQNPNKIEDNKQKTSTPLMEKNIHNTKNIISNQKGNQQQNINVNGDEYQDTCDEHNQTRCFQKPSQEVVVVSNDRVDTQVDEQRKEQQQNVKQTMKNNNKITTKPPKVNNTTSNCNNLTKTIQGQSVKQQQQQIMQNVSSLKSQQNQKENNQQVQTIKRPRSSSGYVSKNISKQEQVLENKKEQPQASVNQRHLDWVESEPVLLQNCQSQGSLGDRKRTIRSQSTGQDRIIRPSSQNQGSFSAIEKSQQLVNQSKQKRLKEIFEIMDSDSDGFISADKIEIQNLSTEVIEAFSGMLLRMEHLNVVLDFTAFLSASEKVLEVKYQDFIYLERKLFQLLLRFKRLILYFVCCLNRV